MCYRKKNKKHLTLTLSGKGARCTSCHHVIIGKGESHSLHYIFSLTSPLLLPATPALLPDPPHLTLSCSSSEISQHKGSSGLLTLCQIVLCLHDRLSSIFPWSDFPEWERQAPAHASLQTHLPRSSSRFLVWEILGQTQQEVWWAYTRELSRWLISL